MNLKVLILLLLVNHSLSQILKVLKSPNPGICDKSNHGHMRLVKDRQSNDRVLICAYKDGAYRWKAVDGAKSSGEFFEPGYDCSDILNKNGDAKDGLYWITFGGSQPKKVWCDMTTDGGGFMLIGRKRNASTLSVPSNNTVVEPFGDPHWTSAFGDAPVLDFRVQMATKEDFKATKAHWYFRLQAKRRLKNLMVLKGCGPNSAGIGNIAYVKDLVTDKIVSTKFRCSKFGYGHHPFTKSGWFMMNSCFQKPCRGFSYHEKYPFQTDYTGVFSYSVSGNISGIEHDATALVGCDNKHCCGCYGPIGGTKDYCTKECRSINGGIITSNVFTWFWVRSALPKRVWDKCMEYKVVKDNGNIVWYKLLGENAVPTEGRCSKNNVILHDGVVVVPDASTVKKIPLVAGLLAYRKDNKELYIRANKTWNVIAQENEVSSLSLKLSKLKKQVKYIIDLPDYPECSNYTWLREANRNKKDTSSTVLCDNHLSGWYRFGGEAGIKMPTSCVPEHRCGTHAAGWMNGVHPTVSDGKVTRKVCFHWSSNCCLVSINIEVLNCGYFYIYKLSSTSGWCNRRYCGTDN